MKNHPRICLSIILAVLLILGGLTTRFVQYAELNAQWNKGHCRIQDALATADTIRVISDFQKNRVIAELNNKEKIQRMLELIEFKPTAPVSFWKSPMLPRYFKSKHGHCLDYVKIHFYSRNKRIGYFWISKKCKELTYYSVTDSSTSSERGILTDESYENVTIWFLSHGVSHYI